MKHCLQFLLLAALSTNAATIPALKDVYRKDFLIGAALNSSQFTGENAAAAALVAAQFDSTSPENVMKWEQIHPWPNTYNFGPADAYVNFGVKHKMFIVGHNLIWHSQTPSWVFQGDKGEPITRDALLKRMHDHIFAVAGRYKGKIGGWDVVNEALNEDGTLRQSHWFKIIGEDYLLDAYQWAHEADPHAQLYYNDYSMENPAKRAGGVALIRKLQSEGVPIFGVGLQGHYKMDWPSPQEINDTINAFSALGVKVMITELDVDLLRPSNRSADVSQMEAAARSTGDPYANGLPEPMQRALADRYAELFKVFLNHRGTITRVTFWGVGDGDSWLNRGRKNYPLLFDRQYQPKPAFNAVISVAR
ncbi:MAG TPA: endo-1,4-beta-xylanase [Verrucomicrobiae bacterium]|nr:endo-1,4-beta-xylanase [Verrucomicrobiae bacterium]